ncbi:hypothetical protein QU481_17840 [Crenobacter sp. SG2303]|uniref:Uncharacterized protein n=1 Tax=Crenobacter oryzisoli TaxID=3056844 RepID=A0ABT7XSG4_9NEIS|nr:MULTISPECIES: hypothetical protein [unclassified Crenobacter]MDN0076723.1 hypothetical protein [Crenobacter sp. SG2303]MDN0085568.1 hypothetical protein [Crenobacter sp. SG2305]
MITNPVSIAREGWSNPLIATCIVGKFKASGLKGKQASNIQAL